MPTNYKIDGNEVINKPSINYINKDFIGIKDDLIQYAKSYFPNTYKDFNETSPGMMMMELSAYVGDMLSFYIDQQFKEMFLSTVSERKNVYQLAKTMGYKPKVSSAAFTNVLFRQKVGADGIGPNKTPKMSDAMVLNKGATLMSSINNTSFKTLDICDFNLTGSKLIPSAFDSSTGVPTEYILSQNVPCASMTTKIQTFNISSPKQFLKLTILDTNVLNIESVTDTDGNIWYEVDSLAQDKVFDQTHWSNSGNSRGNAYHDESGAPIGVPVPYKLDAMRTVNRRFISEVNSDNTTSLVFGNGVLRSNIGDDGSTHLDDVFDNSQELNSLLQGNLPAEFDPTISYSSLGEAPGNTTLTVRYNVGGGVSSNVPGGSIDKIISYETLTTGHTQAAEDSLSVINLFPAGGGKDAETVEEIRQQVKANFSAQNRVITKSDYEARIKALPGRFGNVAKVFVKRKGVGELDSAFNIFDLNTDENNDGVPDDPPNVGGTADMAAFEQLFLEILNSSDGDQITVNSSQITFLQNISAFINNAPNLSVTNLSGWKNLDIHILSYDINNNLVKSPMLLKDNINQYLTNFKALSDEARLRNAVVINFGVKFKVISRSGVNRHELKVKCIDEIKKHFETEHMEINKPIYIPDISNVLYAIDGVKIVSEIKVSQNANILGISNHLYYPGGNPPDGVSGVGPDNYGYAYNFEEFQGQNSDGIIKPAHISTPSIFELKNPNENIRGVVE